MSNAEVKEVVEVSLRLGTDDEWSLVKRAAIVDGLIRIMGSEGLLPNHFNDVKAFNEKFGLMIGERPQHLTRRKLKERVEFLLEELQEFADACGLEISSEHGDNEPKVGRKFTDRSGYNDQDLPAQADALVDLVYVALGTAVMLGLPWQQLWDDVQRANMAKVRGATKRGHRVDCMKPEGWVGPQGEKILAQAGYDRNDYEVANWKDGRIDEAKCHDDL